MSRASPPLRVSQQDEAGEETGCLRTQGHCPFYHSKNHQDSKEGGGEPHWAETGKITTHIRGASNQRTRICNHQNGPVMR